jgi:integrase
MEVVVRIIGFYCYGLSKDNGYANNNPFKGYSVGESVYGTPIYISNDERKKLYEAELPSALAVQRDIFVFQCQNGCRVSDLMKFTWKNVIKGDSGALPRHRRGDEEGVGRVFGLKFQHL